MNEDKKTVYTYYNEKGNVNCYKIRIDNPRYSNKSKTFYFENANRERKKPEKEYPYNLSQVIKSKVVSHS